VNRWNGCPGSDGRKWDTGNGADGIYLHDWKDEKAFAEGQHN
jgi:hypothetical protein